MFKKKPIFFIDGGCSGNGQKDLNQRTMVSVVSDGAGKILSDITNHGGSNNLAEFLALEHCIEYALKQKLREVEIITDSTNTVAWFNRDDSRLKKPRKMNDYEWYQAVKGRIDDLKRFIDIELIWRPREENLAGHYIEEKYTL